jgi:aspartate/methionine/tyrosine aminotransferase
MSYLGGVYIEAVLPGNSSGVYICKSIVNDLRHGNYIGAPGIASVFSWDTLEDAYASSLEKGRRPRGLLLTNPHNPLGTVYAQSSLEIAIRWTKAKQMHLICDEIYALSVFDPKPKNPFLSIVNLMENQLGDYVHVLWGLSKDFGASGLRLGVGSLSCIP